MKLYIYLVMPTFVLFALLQINDPDPLPWICLYLYAAFCGYNALKGGPPAYAKVGLFAFAVGAIHFFPPSISTWIHAEEQAKGLAMNVPFVEEAREAMGLALASAHCGVLLLLNKKLR